MAIELLYAQPQAHSHSQIKGSSGTDSLQPQYKADEQTSTEPGDSGSFAEYRRQASKQASAEQASTGKARDTDKTSQASLPRDETTEPEVDGFSQHTAYASHQAGTPLSTQFSAVHSGQTSGAVTGTHAQLNPQSTAQPLAQPGNPLNGQPKGQDSALNTPAQPLFGPAVATPFVAAYGQSQAQVTASGLIDGNSATTAAVSATAGTAPQTSLTQASGHTQSLSSLSGGTLSSLQGTTLPGAEASPADWLTQRSAGELMRSAPQAQLLSPLTAAADAQTQVDASQASRQTVSQWGPLPLTPNAQVPQHARELLQPLREQLRFQLDQHIQKAELRLDPPDMGKVDLNIRLDGDRLHIQMHAANNHIRDALQSGLERLRAELAQDHQGDIQLDVGQQGGDTDQRQAHSHQDSQRISATHLSDSDTGSQPQRPTASSDLNLLA
ncbi:flagellar hook-length control protein FliK [Shewanella submarina]|uniref:Flagellar hook-length control protein FliK n=1 Tax=Shewanella submarina TaxID=2016376 RepID=A0ABV7GG00_9GAMM|nr:flagellar hook-length control protein FliK [Shewanella submarina]MCL1038718.1 flagellar hook-length control protein FliK [Shewanella submarina]